jgi:GcrA cell cycle regulator
MDSIWTAERIERLTELNAEGCSYQRIAIELACGITRNAVCGKISRMKLPHTPSKEHKPCGKRKRQEPMQRRTSSNYDILANIAIAASEPGIPEQLKGEEPDGTGIKLSDLTDFTCRWPRGDPKTSDFEFCGKKAIPGMPYCAWHCQIAYTVPQARKTIISA